jgi:hypothetical protein
MVLRMSVGGLGYRLSLSEQRSRDEKAGSEEGRSKKRGVLQGSLPEDETMPHRILHGGITPVSREEPLDGSLAEHPTY